MKAQRAFCAALLLVLAFAISPSHAQMALVVDSCGSLPTNLDIGPGKPIYQDKTGKQCVAATVSATVTGFQSNGVFANLTATASSSASTALPAGATSVRITNAGSGTVSCTFATGAATGVVNNIQVGPSSSVSRAVGSFDHIACIDQTGSSGSQLVVVEGGSGLGNDTGGGSSSGGASNASVSATGSAVPSQATYMGILSGGNLVGWDKSVTVASGGVASGAYAAGAFQAGAGVDGWDLTQGAKADAACGTDNGTCSVAALIKRNNQNLTTLNGTAANPINLEASSSEPSKVTTANPAQAFSDLVGKQVTSPYANRENFLNCAVTITGTGATTCTGMGAQGASVKIYITDLCITRNDAGTTAVSATLNDSATTIIDIPNNGGGGGFCKTFNVPLQVAANTAFQITMSGSITSIHGSASGFKGY